MKIIAVDPGYDRVGIAILEKNWVVGSPNNDTWIYSETFKTSKEDDINNRLFAVGERIRQLCKEYQPEHLAIENLFFANNAKTVMAVSQARGIIMFAAHSCGLQVSEFTPLQIKAAVAGDGRADKRSVIDMTCKLVRIPEPDQGRRLDDEYDAIACGLTFFAHFKSPSRFGLDR